MRKLALIMSLFLCVGLEAVFAQTKNISGVVTGKDDGQPIPGVSVSVKGSSLGTVTSIDGTYSLAVSADASAIVFRFVGLKTQEIAFTGQSKIDVVMESDALQVEEVVVTALGIKREVKALGYATSTVSAEDLSRSGEQNAVQALAAKASGVQVISSAGVPGASSKILIRGNSSFTGNNQPLIVVDGVPIDNSTIQTNAGDNPYNKNLEGVDAGNRALDINPDDIESVTILKGASAAALYGVRAANGVILYTTKKGKAGKMQASYEYQLELSEVSQLPEFQNTYSQGNKGAYTMSTYQSWGAKMSEIGITPTDNVKEFFKQGLSRNHNVSLSGGNEKSNFRLSLGRTDMDGVIPNSYFDRTSVRISGESEMAPGLKVGGTANYVQSIGNQPQKGSNLSGITLSLFRTPASFKLYDGENGGYMTSEGEQRKYWAAYDNPYWSAENNTNVSKVDRVMGNIYGNYNYKWLTLDYKLGIDSYTDSRKGIVAIGSYGGDAGDGLGEVSENIIHNRELYSNFIASARKALDNGLEGTISIGHNLNEQYYQSLYGRARVLSAPDFYNLSNGSDLYTDETEQTIRTSALFFIGDFAYKNYLYLNVTGRNEWASTLGSKQKDFFYPSATGSFVFSELMDKNAILSFGKIRLGWAKAGNNPGAYGTVTYYTQPIVAAGMTGGLGWPYLDQTGFSRSSVMGNAELKPEMTTEVEVGADLRFLNGRLGLDFTYYNKNTKDILVNMPIAPSTGYSSLYVNSGEMVNKGVELTISATPIKTKDWTWDLAVNYSKNTNEVKKLAPGVDEINIESAFQSFGSYAIVGKPYGALYSDYFERDSKGKLIVDADGYPIIAANRGNVGNPFPDWLMNIRNSVNYKNVTLSFLFDIREGGDIWGGTIARLNMIGRSKITEDREGTMVVDGVTESGASNTVAIPKKDYFQYVVGDAGPGGNAVFDGSWIRLRDLSLSYRYKIKGTASKYVKDITLTATGKNLWLQTDYPGVDPETSLTGAGSNLTGFDYFNSPGVKSYLFSAKVNF